MIMLCSRSTIRKFVVAAQFIEVLRSFEAPFGMREEVSAICQVVHGNTLNRDPCLFAIPDGTKASICTMESC